MPTRGRAFRRVSELLSIAMLAAGCSDAVTSTPAPRHFPPTMSRIAVPTSDQHVFLLNGNVPADFTARVAARGGAILSTMSDIGVVVTQGLSDADATALAGKDAVARDYIGRWVPTPDEMQLSATMLSTPVEAASASSPLTAAFLPIQWNMFQIHAPEAWATRTGIPSVRVAILDSGLDPDHLDQQGLIDVASSIAFVPSVTGPPAWADDLFHGTYVGGIVTSNNFGTAGVAPNVTLIAVKVLGANGSGPIGATIAGIYYATTVHAQVINMSLGLYLPKNVPGASTLHSAMNRAVNYAKSHGALVVSAAGNDTTDLQHDRNFIELPCEAGVQLCVSATGNGDTHASYSNYGTNAINVAAPGGDDPFSPATYILSPCSSRSALPQLAACKSRVRYLFATGTSASAPHVSGLAAYLDSQYGGTLDPSRMLTLIQQNADDIGKGGADPYFGKGRINVVNTVTTTHP
jgi:subtilisin family serine protease